MQIRLACANRIIDNERTRTLVVPTVAIRCEMLFPVETSDTPKTTIEGPNVFLINSDTVHCNRCSFVKAQVLLNDT